MRHKGLVLTLPVVIALCLHLVGCGDFQAAAKQNFVGTWAVEQLSLNDQSMGNMDSLVQSMGMYLTLEDGGKATFEMLGNTVSGTWKAKDASTATVSLAGGDAGGVDLSGEQEVKASDGKITMTSGQDSMTFVRIDPSQKVSASADDVINNIVAESQAAPAAAPAPGDVSAQLSDIRQLDATVADDDVCTIKVTAAGSYFGDPGFSLLVTNKGEEAIHVDDNNEFSVNDTVASPVFSMDVPAGQTAGEILWFENSDIKDGGVDALMGATGTLVVTDAEGKQLATYDFSVAA